MDDLINQVHCMDFEALCDAIKPQSIDLIASDLPYGQTQCTWDKRVDFDTLWRCVKRVLKPRGVFLTTASEPFASLLRVSNLDWYKYDWVLKKNRPSDKFNAKNKPLKAHEVICIFSPSMTANGSIVKMPYYPQGLEKTHKLVHGKTGQRHHGTRPSHKDNYILEWTNYPISILDFPKDDLDTIHPTQKPVPLYEYLIRTYTQPGDVVLDPFCGSGTTGLAALRTGRRYILGDSDAGYVEAARQRIQNADPMQDSEVKEGVIQHSLWGG